MMMMGTGMMERVDTCVLCAERNVCNVTMARRRVYVQIERGCRQSMNRKKLRALACGLEVTKGKGVKHH